MVCTSGEKLQSWSEGLANALLTADEHVNDDFMSFLVENIFQGNLEEAVTRHWEQRADAAFLVEEGSLSPLAMVSVTPTSTVRSST